MIVSHEFEAYDVFGGKDNMTAFMESQCADLLKSVSLCNTSGFTCTTYVDCYKRI